MQSVISFKQILRFKPHCIIINFQTIQMKNTLLFLAIYLLYAATSACNKSNNVKVERAFYYWKSNSVNSSLQDDIRAVNVKKVYYKFFEVDYSDVRGNFPYNKNTSVNYSFEKKDSMTIVPSVFIKNEVFKFNDNQSLDKLADNIVFLINKYIRNTNYHDYANSYDEIQIDCDWTKSTKEKYFYLLKKIKMLSGKKLSCTLRLYPYAYSDIMGVPPVDKVSLMCYNLINPLSDNNKNSILDIAELKKYLTKKVNYPLHIDLALPLFYWTIVYQNNQFVRLLDLDSRQIKGFTKNTSPLWYEVTKDTTIDYYMYLREGDKIKCEEIDYKTLLAAIDIIKKNVVLNNNVTISLFDLDEPIFKKYSNEEINAIYNRFAQ